MGTPAKFRYSLKTGDDTQWYYLEFGIVRKSSSPRYLEAAAKMLSPKEWKGTVVELSRNENYHGLFTNFSVPLSFALDAQDIVRQIWASEGSDGEVIFVVEVTDTFGNYSVLYKGNLNFSDVQGVHDFKEIHFQTTATEAGNVENFKNKESDKFELDFNSQAITVYNDGVKLKQVASWLGTPNGLQGAPQYFDYGGDLTNEPVMPLMAFIGTDTSPYLGNQVLHRTQELHAGSGATGILEPNKFIQFSSIALQVEVEYDFDIEVTVANNVQQPPTFAIRLTHIPVPVPTGGNVPAFIIYLSPAIPVGTVQRFTRSGKVTIAIPANHLTKVIISADNGVRVTNQNVNFRVRRLNIKFNITGSIPPTTYPAYQYKTFLDVFFKKMLGNHVSVASSFLDTDFDYSNGYDSNPKWVTVTSGDAIRGAVNPKLKVSLQDIRKDLRRWGCNIGIEGDIVRVERLPYFYQKNRVITRLTNVNKVKFQTATNLLFNKIKMGCTTKVHDELNGREDFFVTSEVSFPLLRVSSELDLVSSFHMSCWAIEYLRALRWAGKDTTDSKYDEEIYLTEVEDTAPSGFYKVKRHGAAGLFGLSYPDTIYNIGLSPATSKYWNAEALLAAGWGKPISDGRTIAFNSQDKDGVFSRFKNSKYIAERGDISFSDLSSAPNHTSNAAAVQPYCKPVIIEIEAAITEDLLDKLRQPTQDRYGVVEFVNPRNGAVLSMFILDIGIYPETNELYLIRGLSSPDNNLNNL